MKVRIRNRVRRPPDLTSLFDVLFIVVFVALIRAAAAQQALAQATAVPDRPVAPPRPAPPPDVAALRTKALASLHADLAARTPLVIRISAAGTIETLEVDGTKTPLDAPLLEHSPDPDVAIAYLGDRSAELRLCHVAALHLQMASLAGYLVIVAPAQPLADLSHALYDGLHRDLDRCFAEQRGLAAIVDPAALTAPAAPEAPGSGH